MYERLGLGSVRPLLRRSFAGLLLVFAFMALIAFTIPGQRLQEASARLRVETRNPTFFKAAGQKPYSESSDTLDELRPLDTRPKVELLPWYFNGGQRRPKPQSFFENATRRLVKLWPEEDPGNDRMENQLMFVPESLEEHAQPKLKKIVLYDGFYSWDNVKRGQATFLEGRCPVDTCSLTDSIWEASHADAVLFRDYFARPSGFTRPPNQIWILYTMESPINMRPFFPSDVFNWTMTYRTASDVPIPYARWLRYADHGFKPRARQPLARFNKTRKVAWVVSNCNNKNGRLDYAKELSKYIDVDIYGKCGTLKCTSTYPDLTCFTTLAKHYKFYLSFENSNCLEYITEKFFSNGLGHNMLPVVMGAPPEHYARVAPPHSYIHVDEFDSPRELAEYLLVLDRDEALYDSYFRWQQDGEIIANHAYCRLCAVLHDQPDKRVRHYQDINAWWRPPRRVHATGALEQVEALATESIAIQESYIFIC